MDLSQQRRHTEYFHLAFLALLGPKLDRHSYALKGGANLRFFLKSMRLSEDMDFDVGGIEIPELRDRVAAILKSDKLKAMLAVRGVRIEHVTESKQTATTQRWKIGLAVPDGDLPVPTKIEFSRRRVLSGTVFETVDPLLVREHQIAPFFARHYPAETAWFQKLEALASRREPQARDVFDLHFLLSSGAVDPQRVRASLPAEVIDRARERCLSLGFKEFKGQILSFLPPDQQRSYDASEVWDAMVLRVLDALERSYAAH